MNLTFMIYAKEDKAKIDQIYIRLKESELNPWMDRPPSPYELCGIMPGEDWDEAIRTNIKQADVVLAFLSKKSIAKNGYVQKEYRLALSQMMERPQDSIYLIPVLLEHCTVPDIRVDTVSIRQRHWYELYKDDLSLLIEFLKNRPAEDSAPSKNLEVISLRNRINILEQQLHLKDIEKRHVEDQERAFRFKYIRNREGGYF